VKVVTTEAPSLLRLYIGGFLGPSYTVTWQGSGLLYEPDSLWLEPTDREWEQFWDRCDELRVWDWKPEYHASSPVMDGTSWEVHIVCRRGSVNSSGSNAYPPGGGMNETKKFRAFCEVVSALVEGNPFR
jgi:hypothetical protein